MNYGDTLRKVAEHVALFFIEHNDDRLVYHNRDHTTEMVDAVKKMAEWYKLDKQSSFIVCTAAWFHDTGYLQSDSENHENKSAELAIDFLQNIAVDDETINAVKNCILATRMPQNPVTLLEKIVCDADFFYLGTPSFEEHSQLLKKEYEQLNNKKIKGQDWRAQNIHLLESHKYHTEYCQILLEETKALNLQKLKQKQEKKLLQAEAGIALTDKTIESEEGISSNAAKESDASPDNNDKSLHEKAHHKKNKRPDRGIETMFRVSFASHQKLSALADNKAHIMISVNAIVISVTVGLVVHNFSTAPYLIIPTIILLLVNVATIIFSVLATRPKNHSGIFSKEQLDNKTVNLLFYGSFYKMNYKEYEAAMLRMMEDGQFLYTTMIKDIYWQGRIMGRKFRLLRIAYDIFMYGIAIAVLGYMITASMNL